MHRILILGAGRSSAFLIQYLLRHAAANQWVISVADVDPDAARRRIGNAMDAVAIRLDVSDPVQVEQALSRTDVVVSLMPPQYQAPLAQHCLDKGVHLFGASYTSPEMQQLHNNASKKGLMFLGECGLDPGIDHMSIMKMIGRVRQNGGIITSLESFAGGLISHETQPDNPWRYKFTWNPRNVVTAGHGVSTLLRDGARRVLTHRQVFVDTFEVMLPGGEAMEGYVNRDALKYVATYGLEGVRTFVRGTLRHKGFSAAWNVFVQLGCCNEAQLHALAGLTHRGYIESFLGKGDGRSTEEKLTRRFGLEPMGHELACLRWSGFLDDEPVGMGTGNASAAEILRHILDKKWRLLPGDRDRIVMWHRIGFEREQQMQEEISFLDVTGDNDVDTAMARTVGLPLGIAVRLFMQGKIKSRGVRIPVEEEFYNPILAELENFGIAFRH